VDKYSPYAKRFEAYVSMLCEKMTLTDAASVAEIDWKAAKRIDKKYLSRLVTGLEDLIASSLLFSNLSAFDDRGKTSFDSLGWARRSHKRL
jgi:hypothetical protein